MALNEQSSFPLVLLTSISAPLLGAANTLLYSCSPEMRQQIHPSFIWVYTDIHNLLVYKRLTADYIMFGEMFSQVD